MILVIPFLPIVYEKCLKHTCCILSGFWYTVVAHPICVLPPQWHCLDKLAFISLGKHTSSCYTQHSIPKSALQIGTCPSCGHRRHLKVKKWSCVNSYHMHFFFSPILDYPLLNFSLLFVCVYVCVCDFCSEEGKGSPLVDGWKWSSACQQGIIDSCKGQQAFKSHPTPFVSSLLSLPSLFLSFCLIYLF